MIQSIHALASDLQAQWFYFEAHEHLDVVRLLGDRQDIIAILGDAI